ncbi:MAG: hypothetical protein IJF84_07100 [Thermoguttaceae bacterium]|nr:hypothetical protein [Thermoguttaceae bacterium]
MILQKIKEKISSLFKSKGADAAFVVDKFENYNNGGTIQESTQKAVIIEDFFPLVVEPGAVVDGVKIDATDDPELDVNDKE